MNHSTNGKHTMQAQKMWLKGIEQPCRMILEIDHWKIDELDLEIGVVEPSAT